MIFNDVFILKLMSRSGMVILTIQYYMKLFILTKSYNLLLNEADYDVKNFAD